MKYGLLLGFSCLVAACGASSAGSSKNDAACTSAQANATRCSGSTLQTCDGSVWRNTQDCSATGDECTTSAIGASCMGSDCTGSETRCAGNVLETCSQGDWVFTQNCTGAGLVCTVAASGASCAAAVECSSEGAERCNGDVVQECQSGAWTDVTDCAATGKTCDTGTATCETPSSPYTHEGFVPGANATSLFYDDDLFEYHTLLSTDSFAAPTMQITVENFPGWDGSTPPGQSSTQPLAGVNASYATCGTCVIGKRGSGSSAKYFLGTEGSVAGSWPTMGGGAGSATLANVKMEQFSLQTGQLIQGGETWFVASAQLMAPASSRYPCFFWGSGNLLPGHKVCGGLSNVIVCNSNDGLEMDATCTDNVQKCVQDTPTTTSCATLPCQDPGLVINGVDYRLDAGESLCWSATQIVSCSSGNVAPSQTCGSPQTCVMADTGTAASCE